MSTADPSALAQGAKETLSACAHRLVQTSGGKLVVLGPQDWHAVIALEQAIFPEDPWTPGMVAEELSSGLSVYFGVCADAPQGELPVLCGYAGVKVGLDSDVMTMGVLPDFRGRGLGRALMDALLELARQRGSERVFLEVRASNTPAITLYEQSGFERVGVTKNYVALIRCFLTDFVDFVTHFYRASLRCYFPEKSGFCGRLI